MSTYQREHVRIAEILDTSLVTLGRLLFPSIDEDLVDLSRPSGGLCYSDSNHL
jgi:hypothetical protein